MFANHGFGFHLPLAIHPPNGCGLGQAYLDEFRETLLPVHHVCTPQSIQQLVGSHALCRPPLDQRLNAQGGQVLEEIDNVKFIFILLVLFMFYFKDLELIRNRK